MVAANDPYQVIGELGLAFLFLAGLWRLIVWVRDAPVKPDPWDAEVAEKLSDPETPEVCPHCSTPQPTTARYCAQCGRTIGYNNVMPFLYVSDGQFHKRPLTVVGYLLLSVTIGSFLAPIFWYFLLFNEECPPDPLESVQGTAPSGPSA